MQAVEINIEKDMRYSEAFSQLMNALHLLEFKRNRTVKMYQVRLDHMYSDEVETALGVFFDLYSTMFRIASFHIPEHLYSKEVNNEVYFVDGDCRFIGVVERDVLIMKRDTTLSKERELVSRLNPSVIIRI